MITKIHTIRQIFLAAVAAVMTAAIATGCSSDDDRNIGARVDEELLELVDRLRGPVVVATRQSTGDYQAAEEELEALIES